MYDFNFWEFLEYWYYIDISTFHLNDYTEHQDPYWEFSTEPMEFCLEDKGYTKEQALVEFEKQYKALLWDTFINNAA